MDGLKCLDKLNFLLYCVCFGLQETYKRSTSVHAILVFELQARDMHTVR